MKCKQNSPENILCTNVCYVVLPWKSSFHFFNKKHYHHYTNQFLSNRWGNALFTTFLYDTFKVGGEIWGHWNYCKSVQFSNVETRCFRPQKNDMAKRKSRGEQSRAELCCTAYLVKCTFSFFLLLWQQIVHHFPEQLKKQNWVTIRKVCDC